MNHSTRKLRVLAHSIDAKVGAAQYELAARVGRFPDDNSRQIEFHAFGVPAEHEDHLLTRILEGYHALLGDSEMGQIVVFAHPPSLNPIDRLEIIQSAFYHRLENDSFVNPT